MTALVVHAHPVATSLVAAVRDRVVAGLRAGGADVDLVDLYADGFDPTPGAASVGGAGGVEAYRARLARADALVLVHPTWWGGPPAILAGFLQQVVPAAGDRLAHVRDVAVFATHGSPWRTNAFLEGEPGKLLVSRRLRLRCSWRTRVTWTPLYGVDRSTDADRAEYLARAEAVAVRVGRRSAARRR